MVVAGRLGLKSAIKTPEGAQFTLVNVIVAKGPTRTRDMVVDGNISAQFLNNYDRTLDLQHARTWLSPVPTDRADSAR